MEKLLNELTGEYKDMAYDIGMEEVMAGKLRRIKPEYSPFVKNLDLTNPTRAQIKDLADTTGMSEDLIKANLSGSGRGSILKDFKTRNVSSKQRKYGGSTKAANFVKQINTSSDVAREEFLQRMAMEHPTTLKALEKSDAFKITNLTLKVKPEDMTAQDAYLLSQIDPDVLEMLDGIPHYFETSAVKAFLVRSVRHNDILYADNVTRSLLEGMGEKVDLDNYKSILQKTGTGFDIVATRSDLNKINTSTLRDIMRTGKTRAQDLDLHQTATGISQLKADAKRTGISLIDTDSDILRENSKALVALSDSDVEKLVGMFSTKNTPIEMWAVPKEVRREYNDIAQKQISDGFKSMTGVLDGLHRIWKPLVTGLRPDFHLRNYISSNINDAIENGIKSFQPKYKVLGNKIAREAGDSSVVIAGREFSTKALREEMQQRGAFSTMYRSVYDDALDMALAKDIKSTGKASMTKARDLYETVTHKVGNVVEDNVRATNFAINMEKALKSGMSTGEAMDFSVDMVKKYHFDYTDLSEVERTLFRRVMPFYTWSRKNLPLQMETMLNDPGFYGKVGSIQQTSEQVYGQGDEGMPEWAKSNLPVALPFSSNKGNTAYLSGAFPMSDLDRVVSSPGDKVKEGLNMLSPALKVPAEIALNRSFLSGAPLWQTEYEKSGKIASHMLSQAGAGKDMARGISPPETSGGAFGPFTYDNPVMQKVSDFGLGRSLLKQYDVDKGDINKAYEYLRYLSDYKQGLEQQGVNVPTIPEIRSGNTNDDLLSRYLKKY